MLTRNRVAIGVLSLFIVLAGVPTATQPSKTAQRSTIEQIRDALLKLPYYGVFDFLAFSYDKGTVRLTGYAYRLQKEDAERAVKRVPGVDTVINEIEVLPASLNDDEIRWRAYYNIYGDPFLARYAPGGGVLWGHRHPTSATTLYGIGEGRFLGMEPAGDYPIHIIVKNGRITLLGVVDNESDKTVAELKAREVPGTFGVENLLIVDKKSS